MPLSTHLILTMDTDPEQESVKDENEQEKKEDENEEEKSVDDTDDQNDEDDLDDEELSLQESDEEEDTEDNFDNPPQLNEIEELLSLNEQDVPYYDEEDDNEDEDDDDYLQKFDDNLRKDIIQNYHPELIIHSNEDIQAYSRIVKNEKGIIIDPLHKTLPFVTKYERARILGERAKQIENGAKPLVVVEDDVIDGYLIALKEFEEKKIPFIVKRPMPNGGCEYWKLKDLEII